MLRRSLMLSLFAASLFVVSASGDESFQIHVAPRLPTTITPIEFRFPTYCGDEVDSIVRTGSVITIRYSSFLCNPPFPHMARVPLPEKTLPVGQYRVDFVGVANRPHPDRTLASATFTVRPAEPQPLRVRPSVLFRGGGIRIERTDGTPVCPEAGCDRVLIGGQPVLNVNPDGGAIWVSTPSAPGVYDVTVITGGTQLTAKGALYVFNETSGFDATQFERILLPIHFNGPGGHGSQWVTEQVISNRRPWNIDTGHIELSLGMVWFARVVEANAYYRGGFGGPFGTALLLPRADADDVSISIRIRDTSRVSEGFGTEIPVVREEDMAYNEPVTLLDVPLETRYREKLRVYAFLPDVLVADARVQFVARGGDAQPALQVLQLRRDCATCPEMPLYGELDLPATTTLGRIDVRIDGPDEALTWGFITVTNNETQQVTTVTPQQ